MDTLSATSCIKFGWNTLKKRPWLLIGATAIVMILISVINSLSHGSMSEPVAHEAISIIGILLSVLIDLGMISFFLKAHDDVAGAKLADLWHTRSYGSYLAAVVMVGVLTAVGLVLLIVPGVVVILMMIFVKFLIADRNKGPIEAMKESARITRGNRMELLLLVVLAIAINIVGVLLLVVGLLVTIPVSVIALAHAYRELSGTAAPAPSPVA